MLRNKIIRFNKVYKFYFDYFLIKCTVFVLNVKNVIKNQKFNFSDKLCDIQKKIGIFYLKSHFSQMWLFQSTDSVYLCVNQYNPSNLYD